MNPIPKSPGLRNMCPESCRYRNRLAPFCGYCMMEILDKNRTKEDAEYGKTDTEAAGQAGKEGL